MSLFYGIAIFYFWGVRDIGKNRLFTQFYPGRIKKNHRCKIYKDIAVSV